MIWAWGWVGCGEPCPPLSRVPVSGGAAAAEGAISDVLAQLERELALPVCVDHVRIGWISGSHHRGMYNPVTRGVRVAADEPLDGLEMVVRHEVCHAVDYQNDVVRDHPGVFDAADASRSDAGESFAWACQVGRAPFEAWWDDGCPTSAAAEVLRDEVFSVSAAPPPGAWFEPVAGFDAGAETYFALYPTEGSILRILGSMTNGWFDPHTGRPIDPDAVPPELLEAIPALAVPA
ncbi:MAG: hypothetical protein ABMA64_21130, partial [Myxococcota bacterium]